MRRYRRKKRYLPGFDAAERRDLPSATPLAVISAPAKHATVVSLSVRVGDNHHFDHAFSLHAGQTNAITLTAKADAHARRESASSPGQGQIADSYLELAKIVFRDLLKHEPASESARMHRAISQIQHELVRNPMGAPQAAESNVIDSILAAVGPGDPFAYLPVMSESQLQPGDIIVRNTPGLEAQVIEIGSWSRYDHVALYVGNGQVVDSTDPGVRIRPLTDLLAESDRVGVLRVPGLTAAQAQTAIQAAESHIGAAYNDDGLFAISNQKQAGVLSHSNEGLGGIIGVLTRAERLPESVVNNGTYWCVQLVQVAFQAAGINPTDANGLSPGDIVRLGTLGVFDEIGRLPLNPPATTVLPGAGLP
jgi:hypothetical protein